MVGPHQPSTQAFVSGQVILQTSCANDMDPSGPIVDRGPKHAELVAQSYTSVSVRRPAVVRVELSPHRTLQIKLGPSRRLMHTRCSKGRPGVRGGRLGGRAESVRQAGRRAERTVPSARPLSTRLVTPAIHTGFPHGAWLAATWGPEVVRRQGDRTDHGSNILVVKKLQGAFIKSQSQSVPRATALHQQY